MRRPALATVPAHRAFADVVASELIEAVGDDLAALSRALLLLPTRRTARVMRSAFLRASGRGGLLLPRMVPIGDLGAGEDGPTGMEIALIDPEAGEPIDPVARRWALMRMLLADDRRAAPEPAIAWRLAGDLGRAIDQLAAEEVGAERLREVAADDADLARHWAASLDHLSHLIDRWPEERRALGVADAVEERNRVLDAMAVRWRAAPPETPVWAAGIVNAAPPLARLLRVVAELPAGRVLWHGLDTELDDATFARIVPPDDAEAGTRGIESHPQHAVGKLLRRMGVDRGEVATLDRATPFDGDAARAALAPALFALPEATAHWHERASPTGERTGLRWGTFPTAADEAQGIALALRGALETPGRTAALVTPDRALARRVVAALGRWGIEADDSAGVPLSLTPPGTLLLAAVEAIERGLAPVALLPLLKHPLVRQGDGRPAWLDAVRRLDMLAREPGRPEGLAGLDAIADAARARGGEKGRAHVAWHEAELRPLLLPVATLTDDARAPSELFAALVGLLGDLSGDAVWTGSAGRQLGQLIATLEREAAHGPDRIDVAAFAAILRDALDDSAFRPTYGAHPRVAILGLVEARMERFDLVVLGGLNEGVWPASAPGDAWLAPGVRRRLGLHSLERAIGLAAQDFAIALTGAEVLLTRAERGADGPTVPSRLWTRLATLVGFDGKGPAVAPEVAWARALDAADRVTPVARPSPCPPRALRPRALAVTAIDAHAVDPFDFYARHVLRLTPLTALGEAADARWRGTRVHALIEAWHRADGDAAAMEALIAELADDPALGADDRALWLPATGAALRWIAAKVLAERAERTPVAFEPDLKTRAGHALPALGVTLKGRPDRVDQAADGRLIVVDYKTGKAPRTKDFAEGRARQLAHLALLAEDGAFEGLDADEVAGLEYWSTRADRDKGVAAVVASPVKGDLRATFERVRAELAERVAAIVGDAPFTASSEPEALRRRDVARLSRRDEWLGRERSK